MNSLSHHLLSFFSILAAQVSAQWIQGAKDSITSQNLQHIPTCPQVFEICQDSKIIPKIYKYNQRIHKNTKQIQTILMENLLVSIELQSLTWIKPEHKAL